MRREIMAVMLVALSGCSDRSASDAKATTKGMTAADGELRRYIDSDKGHRDRDASIAKAQKGTMAAFGTRLKNAGITAFEGAWRSEAAAVDGKRLQVSISRDGIVFMEVIDQAGASSQYAQGSVTIRGLEAAGTLRQGKGDLARLAKWRMRRTPQGIILSGDKISVFLTKKTGSLT